MGIARVGAAGRHKSGVEFNLRCGKQRRLRQSSGCIDHTIVGGQ